VIGVDWLLAAERLRGCREPGVLVTLIDVHGHAPQVAGAKMVVAAGHHWGTIGGGNLEATAVARARDLLASGRATPEQHGIALNAHGDAEHGRQCCGGRVTVLLEPLGVPAAVAVFGVGHVGLELARILARQDLDLHLVDSRADRLDDAMLAPLRDARARIRSHHAPDPAALVADLPAGTHVLVLTHDHAQDAAVCDAALRRDDLGSIGLIGSSAKWARFRVRLARAGHEPAAIGRIRSPIGLAKVPGKDPATIAVSIAAELLSMVARAPAATPRGRTPTPAPPARA